MAYMIEATDKKYKHRKRYYTSRENWPWNPVNARKYETERGARIAMGRMDMLQTEEYDFAIVHDGYGRRR